MNRGIRSVLAVVVVMAGATGARAERFAGVKLLGGAPGVGRRSGVLVVENGEIRLEGRRGQPAFVRPVAEAAASVEVKKGVSGGCILKGIALIPVIAPLSAGMADPWQGCGARRLEVHVRSGGDVLRLKVGKGREGLVAEAINAAARRSAAAGAHAGSEADSMPPAAPDRP
ncbi:MAG TPA: hypothetical protein VGB87_10975 [Vicinamibacteria bacterium]